MALDRAVIQDVRTGRAIPVLFNPEEYSVDAGNSFAEVPIPGAAVPPIQYVRGNARTLKMDLFFDTTGAGTDVRSLTDQVVGLLAPDPLTKGPPVLLVVWGSLQFRCVLERVGQRFTRFLPSGLPVRAYLSVAFREYAAVTPQTETGLFLGVPAVDTLLSGSTTVSGVAGRVLGDPARWRAVADINGIDNPRLPPGRALRLPAADGRT